MDKMKYKSIGSFIYEIDENGNYTLIANTLEAASWGESSEHIGRQHERAKVITEALNSLKDNTDD